MLQGTLYRSKCVVAVGHSMYFEVGEKTPFEVIVHNRLKSAFSLTFNAWQKITFIFLPSKKDVRPLSGKIIDKKVVVVVFVAAFVVVDVFENFLRAIYLLHFSD